MEKEKTTDRALKSENHKEREAKIMNTVVNSSIILMGMMMGAFSDLMINATGAMASGLAEALGDKEAGEEINREIKQKQPEIDDKLLSMISDVRKDIYAQFEQKQKEIIPLLADPEFDDGLKIVEKYQFNLPNLTERLTDQALAQYVNLLVTEDSEFTEMFKELTKWMEKLPISSPNLEKE